MYWKACIDWSKLGVNDPGVLHLMQHLRQGCIIPRLPFPALGDEVPYKRIATVHVGGRVRDKAAETAGSRCHDHFEWRELL